MNTTMETTEKTTVIQTKTNGVKRHIKKWKISGVTQQLPKKERKIERLLEDRSKNEKYQTRDRIKKNREEMKEER